MMSGGRKLRAQIPSKNCGRIWRAEFILSDGMED
jgi:hypothetical protein